MAFQVSPGINVTEIDLTTIIPAVSTTEGAIAGVFRWGPVEQRVLIANEDLLKARFGPPTNLNPETWFTTASFLSYGNRCFVSRAADVTGNNFTREHVGNSTNLAIQNGTAILKLSNTSSLAANMIVLYTNNNAVPVGSKVLSVNSTAVVLDADATANVTAVQVVLRENITYTAVALQDDLNYDVTDITDWDAQIVKNENHYVSREANGQSFDLAALYVARYPGDMGNSLRVSVCDSVQQFKSNLEFIAEGNTHINATASFLVANVGSNTINVTIKPADTANATMVTSANTIGADILADIAVGDLLQVGNTRIGFQFLQVTGLTALSATSNVFTFSVTCDDELKLIANVQMTSTRRHWEFYNSVDVPPEQSDFVAAFGNSAADDELHIVVVDEGGKFSGSPGTILEVYRNLSRATDAKSADGATIYYKDVINQRSNYVWWANDRTTAPSNTANYIATSTGAHPLSMTLVGGADGPDEANVSIATLSFAYDMYRSAEDVDVSLVLQGKARGEAVSNYTQLGNYIIDTIAEARKDCVAFISPDYGDVVNNLYEEAEDIVAFRSVLRSTSYAVLDSGYKYMYDKYNDVYRWIPLNGDMAGLCVHTDAVADPWFSPAGFNRGQIKNIIRLAYNPRKADRDTLYKEGVNPVVTFPGQGTILFGDKTLLAKPSAFDRINVRRLFIVLEKAISTASKFTLFEFNDDFTRTQFKNMVVPYLRDVQGRRGITDFIVICDESNNTPEVIDRNEFIGDIYIKPARSINYIQLNFIAVRTGVAFSEVIGKF